MTRLERIWRAVMVFPALIWLAGCAPDPVPPPEQSGELVVATRNSPTTYFLDADGNPSGFEFDLVSRFAESRGWKVRFVLADTLDALLETVAKGQAHIAAAGLDRQ